MEAITFKPSAPLTLGVELELQLVNTRDCDLTRAASDMLALIEKNPHAGEIKPEITESMIEISTGVHSRHGAHRQHQIGRRLAAQHQALPRERERRGQNAERLRVQQHQARQRSAAARACRAAELLHGAGRHTHPAELSVSHAPRRPK